MTIGMKFTILAVMAIVELTTLFAVNRKIPPERRGPILPVLALSSVVVLALAGYLLFYFLPTP